MNNNDKRSLREKAIEFIIYKRHIGYQYKIPEHVLMKYVDYTESISLEILLPTKESVTSFLNQYDTKPGALYGIMAALREFSRFLISRGYLESYTIPEKRMPKLIPHMPYFFTELEIQRFFEVCDAIKPNKSFKGRNLILPAFYRLMYCCGVRTIEARSLLKENVHLDQSFLDILLSKGPKSRRLFISEELNSYLTEYDERISLIFPKRRYFFPSERQSSAPFLSSTFSNNFHRIWMEAFPNFPSDKLPREYDFRHNFAISNLNCWAREGLDVNVMLPYLMRYMGHSHIKSTLYYFHFVPEFFPTFNEMSLPTEDIIPEVQYEK
jgi:integrase